VVKNLVKKAIDPADVIEINARCFAVKDFYLDEIIQNIFSDKDITLSPQDRDLLMEAKDNSGNYLKAVIKEGSMRVASLIVADIIEKLNRFGETGDEK
jgi:hypothetical protein